MQQPDNKPAPLNWTYILGSSYRYLKRYTTHISISCWFDLQFAQWSGWCLLRSWHLHWQEKSTAAVMIGHGKCTVKHKVVVAFTTHSAVEMDGVAWTTGIVGIALAKDTAITQYQYINTIKVYLWIRPDECASCLRQRIFLQDYAKLHRKFEFNDEVTYQLCLISIRKYIRLNSLYQACPAWIDNTWKRIVSLFACCFG